MAKGLYKENLRYLISIITALLVHFFLFITLHFILNIRIEALPEYSGPIFLEIESDNVPVVKQEESFYESDEKDDPSGKKEEIKEIDTDLKVREKNDDVIATNNTIEDSGRETSNDDNAPLWEDENSFDKTESTPPPGPTKAPVKESTPGPTAYDRALEEDNIALLDKLLDEGGTGDPDSQGKTDTDTTSTGNETTLQTEEGRIVFEWEDNQRRSPLFTVQPEIPAWVAEQGLRLVIGVSFLLTPDGILTSLRVNPSSGYSDVDARVIEALRKWKFRSTSGTENVSGRITYIIDIK